MSEHLPAISGKDFIKLLEKLGFTVIRINGSHHRMKHPDGRITTIPLHKMILYRKVYFVKLSVKIYKWRLIKFAP